MAAVTSAVTAHLAFRRFYSERWWERKAAAYVDLIEALFRLYALPVTFHSVELGLRKELSDEEEGELVRRYREADRAVGKAIAVGNFVISRRAAEILVEFVHRKVAAEVAAEQKSTGIGGLLQGSAAAAKATLEDLKAEARRDLRVDREL